LSIQRDNHGEEVHKSIANSSRTIKSVYINGIYKYEELSPHLLEEDLSHIGKCIEKFEFRHWTNAAKVLQHLKLMPNILEELSLHRIRGSPDGMYFENQRNIRNLDTDDDLKWVNFQLDEVGTSEITETR
jgi:hypothetical protein